MTAVLVVSGLIVALLVLAIVLYNRLVAKRQMVNNGWADIDVQLKRRADLIPSLVATVRGYASHERQLFEEIVDKRNRAREAGDDAAARGAAESALSHPLGRLIALGEGYPELKASANFKDLQDDLADTENKIEMARRFYNGAVRELNTAVETFPGNVIAGPFGFHQAAYFEIETADRAVPEVEFGGKS